MSLENQDQPQGWREKGRRSLCWLLGVSLSAFAIYTSATGPFIDIFQRSLPVGAAMVLLLIAAPLRNSRAGKRLPRFLCDGIDAVLIGLSLLATLWFFEVYEELETGLYDLTDIDMAIGAGALVVLLELSRRVAGMPLFVLTIASIVYCLFGASLPGIFAHAGFGLEETLRTMWYSFDGVFGLPVAVVSALILVFVVFGVLLEGTGAGDTLLKISFSLTGGLRGGPAHAAVVASGLFGTISGSPVGNVVGTGVFTMPMIAKRGFSKAFAGGVESAASSGGQFMPPVMGAVAFIMADLTGESYLTICAAALMPALFFYASLFCAVSTEAARLGLKPVAKAEREKLNRDDWFRSLGFVVPIIVIIFTLVIGRSPATAGFWAIVSGILTGFLTNGDLRANPARLISALARAGRTAAMLLVAVAAIGIVIGAINLTGLGLRFSTLILSFAGDSLFISLLLMMAGSLVLGMGLPTVPAYLIIILVMGPAIQKLGVDVLIAHLFVMYFGVLSNITPPVALAAYAAAPICGADPFRVALVAMRIALIGFIIPFVFVYNPSLVLTGEFHVVDFVWIAGRLALSIWLFSTAFAGYSAGRLPGWSCMAGAVLGVGVVWPDTTVEIVAVVLALSLIAVQRFSGVSETAAQSR